jgi:hypothetical protein
LKKKKPGTVGAAPGKATEEMTMSSVLKLKIKDKRKVGRRGVYRKKAARKASLDMPCAWPIGDKRMFNAVRARAVRGIGKDPGLGSKQKAILIAAIDHMNADERWSCWTSPRKLAREIGCHPATAWRAIEKADGVHILTQRGAAGKSTDSTLITIQADLTDIPRLPGRAMNELERFFEATDALEDKQLEFLGWEGASKAIKTIEKYSR